MEPDHQGHTSVVARFQGTKMSSPKGSATFSMEDDDIQAIRSELEGTSSATRERAYKILDRLGARLFLAEVERSKAFGKKKFCCREPRKLDDEYYVTFLSLFSAALSELQEQHRQMADELHKKRSELRELLRQEETFANKATLTRRASSGDQNAVEGGNKAMTIPGTNQRKSNLAVGLPKVDLKSPARVIEEHERRSTCNSSRSSTARSPPVPVTHANNTNNHISLDDYNSQLQVIHGARDVRRRSGTPTSTKSRVMNA